MDPIRKWINEAINECKAKHWIEFNRIRLHNVDQGSLYYLYGLDEVLDSLVAVAAVPQPQRQLAAAAAAAGSAAAALHGGSAAPADAPAPAEQPAAAAAAQLHWQRPSKRRRPPFAAAAASTSIAYRKGFKKSVQREM